jgi:short-subunit dehydrogenase
MDRQLRILVTGAGRGIGKAIVSQLKSDPLKHKIAVTARTESELKEDI